MAALVDTRHPLLFIIRYSMPHTHFQALRQQIESRVIGMHDMVESMLICLLADGHALLEGMPGLAKTTAVKALAQGIEGEFHRIQFTPDLLPSDVVGTEIFVQEKGQFRFRQGPVFHNVLLADEINRAPAKVQSALLEAMAEHQVTVGHKSYSLPQLFMVLATQNPIEQEGTYPLPEAQLDRFLFHIPVMYPTREEEHKVLKLNLTLQEKEEEAEEKVEPVIRQAHVFAAQREVRAFYMDEKLERYVVDVVQATRNPKPYDSMLGKWIRHGASPRATIGIAKAAKALAWLEGAEYVLPQHVQRVAPNVLRHRLLLTFEAEAENISVDQIIARLLEVVAVA